MKRTELIVVVVLAIAVSACGSSSAPAAIPTIVLDGAESPPSNPSNSETSLSASAIVVPRKQAHLSFTAVGRVIAVNVKVGDQVKAGEVLAVLDTSILEAKVKEAQANLEAAQVQVRYLRRVGTDQVHLEAAEANVAQAQALLDFANAVLLAQSTLTAPFDGTIVSLTIAPSETATPGQIVMVLGDLSSYQIETTDLSERDVTRVRVGQPALMFIEALNAEFTGRVVEVSLVSSTVGGDVVYAVTLEFEDQPHGLLWGMSADVGIQVGQ